MIWWPFRFRSPPPAEVCRRRAHRQTPLHLSEPMQICRWLRGCFSRLSGSPGSRHMRWPCERSGRVYALPKMERFAFIPRAASLIAYRNYGIR